MPTINQTLICDASTREKTQEGFLKVIIRATRTGVMRYHINDLPGANVEDIHGDGYVYVARLPEDVFAKSSLDTMRTASITDEHPGERVVNSDNFKRESTGHVTGDAYHDDHDVYVPAIIKDRAAVNIVDGGKYQVSIGAASEVHKQSGELHGQPYDYTFKNINYNHISVVGRGRAGNAQILDEDNMSKEKELQDEVTRLTQVNDAQSKTIESLEKRLDDIERTSVINDALKIDPDFKAKEGDTTKQVKVSFINDSAITNDSPSELVDYAFNNLTKTNPHNPPKVELSSETTNATAKVNDSESDNKQSYNAWEEDK